jgi:Domain of unknown function (DUF5666)
MKKLLLGLPLAALSLVGFTSHAFAQDAKTARGTVTNIAGSSMTVKSAGQEMKFSVDNKTKVEVRGGSTKTREAAASGKPGPMLADVMRVGQAVSVTYQDMAGSLHASLIRAIPSAGSTGGSSATASSEEKSHGIVKTVGTDSITITGASGGGGTFTQTFIVDSSTKVIAKGAGTMTAKRGGRAPLTDLLANGDNVSVSYHKTGGTLHASDVRVVMRAAH